MPVTHTHTTNGLSAHLPTHTGPTLAITDLAFSYPDGHTALRGISLHIAQGEKVALVGPNGAGKSTLMLHLNGLLKGERGTVEVAGLPVADPHLPLIRAKVGLVFQNPDDQLFSPTVFEDVAFGPLHMGLPEGEVRERVAWGAGPRAGIYLITAAKARAVLQGRYHATTVDVAQVALPVLRHRVLTTFNAEAAGVTSDQIVKRLLEKMRPTEEIRL